MLLLCLLVIKSKNKLLLSILSFLVLAGGVVLPVHAQETATVSAEVIVDDVVSRPVHADEIAATQQQYRQAIEKYREVERQYTVQIGQYQQLQTLSALEAAVQSTRETTLARNEVLTAYLTILNLELLDATGIEVSLKEQYLAELTDRLAELVVFNEIAADATNRQSLDEVRAKFLLLGPQIEATAYQVQTLLAVGKLQTIFDQAVSVTEALTVQVDSQDDSLAKPQRQRALTETRQSLEVVRADLQKMTFRIMQNDDKEFSRSSYSGFVRQLTSVYAGLSQSLAFLAELASNFVTN